MEKLLGKGHMKALWLRLLLKCGIIDRIAWMRSRGLTIGHDCALMHDIHIDPGHEQYITIGNRVTIAPGAMILAHDASAKRGGGVTKQSRVVVGDRVFIGARALILPGVTIGDDCIIGAGSVVTHNIPSHSVACGNPAVVKTDMATFLKKRSA